MTLTLDDANRIIECAIAKGRTPFNRGRRSQSCSIYGETSRWSLDRRVAQYTRRHDVTISAWRLGPFEVLLVDDASSVLLEMQEWERPHPDEERLKRRAASMWDT
jgi:hypothetical protein